MSLFLFWLIQKLTKSNTKNEYTEYESPGGLCFWFLKKWLRRQEAPNPFSLFCLKSKYKLYMDNIPFRLCLCVCVYKYIYIYYCCHESGWTRRFGRIDSVEYSFDIRFLFYLIFSIFVEFKFDLHEYFKICSNFIFEKS